MARPHELTVVTVGDSRVGKTALINRFCDDVFIEVGKNKLSYLNKESTEIHLF